MDVLANLANLGHGFTVALSWNYLLYCLAGVVLGTFVGVLPGLGTVTAISMLMPFTFGLDPLAHHAVRHFLWWALWWLDRIDSP